MNRTKTIAIFLAALAGCGGGSATEATTDETGAGGEQLGAAAVGDAEPVSEHVGDVNAFLMVQSPVGVVPAEHAQELPIHVHLENQSDRPLRLDSVLARVVVSREGEIVCEQPEFGSIELIESIEPVIEPGSERRLVTSLPCGLEETGDYDLLVELLFAEEEDVGVPAPTDPHRAATFVLNVSDREPPYQGVRPVPAEVEQTGGPAPAAEALDE